MSLTESRNKTNTNRVKVLTDHSNLASDTLDIKWNKIQVICTQPFNSVIYYYFALKIIKLIFYIKFFIFYSKVDSVWYFMHQNLFEISMLRQCNRKFK